MKQTKHKLIEINSISSIPEYLINTPVGDLIKYQNCKSTPKTYEKAELVIVMCMDNRKQLTIPGKFAYILRTAGGRITGNEFKLSFAIGFGDVRYVAIIGHTNCGMVNLTSKKDKFIQGLMENAGWDKETAENHFNSFAPFFEIEDETNFVSTESKRLKEKYPKIEFVPFIYKVEDNKLYLVE
jgi:carbonic anhydrase